uniref:Uncharacterized protein n=1 Tax=mine drainage metagenome TaxID=410659 RepID=E6QTY7_9ZZZZ
MILKTAVDGLFADITIYSQSTFDYFTIRPFDYFNSHSAMVISRMFC